MEDSSFQVVKGVTFAAMKLGVNKLKNFKADAVASAEECNFDFLKQSIIDLGQS